MSDRAYARIKLWLLVFGVILIIFLVSAIGVIKTFQKELNAKTDGNTSLFATFITMISLDYDSELEKELKNKSLKQDHNHVSIYYQEENKELIPQTIETLKWADEKVIEVVGEFDEKPIDFIFMDRDKLEQLSDIDGVAGFYSNFDRLIGINVDDESLEGILEENETPLYFFQKKILHEYAHYATFRKLEKEKMSSDSLPEWFVEGVAEFVGNDKTEVHFDSFQYETVPLGSISWGNDFQEARLTTKADPYMQSYFTVNYLIQKHGENVVTELIGKTKETGDFYKALELITGQTLPEFDEAIASYYHTMTQ